MNRVINSTLVLALLTMLLVSCKAPQTNVADVRKAIEEGAERWMTAFNGKDAATLASFYAADAIILPPNGPRVSGRANLEALFTEMFAIGGDLKLAITHVDASGDLAYEVGSYSMSIQMPGTPPMADTGKYVAVWKRQADGKWLIVADTWNTDLPMPTPPPAERKKK
jgi:uncharacterized protein (TIGR02246 family)